MTGNLTLDDTPYIAGLAGGAEIYGLLADLKEADFDSYLSGAPQDALVAVIRLELDSLNHSPQHYADNYTGFDMLVMVNLTDVDLSGPSLGVTFSDSDNYSQALKIDGVGSQQVLTSLGANRVWATLVPDGGITVNASVGGSSTPIHQTISDNHGEVAYIRAVRPVSNATRLPALDAIAASPDGKQIYGVSSVDSALVVINADDLSERQLFKNGDDGITGLAGASGVTVSPDGARVFVTSEVSNTLLIFDRDSITGDISNPATASDEGNRAFTAVAANRDGTRIYTAGADWVFSYATDGILQNFLRLDGAGHLAVSLDGSLVYGTSTTDNSLYVLSSDLGIVQSVPGNANGLQGLSGIAVSGDDRHVYVTAAGSDSLSVFTRNDSTLTLTQTITNNVAGVRGLEGASAVTLTPDGLYVLVTGSADNAIAVFERSATDGSLSFVQVLRNGVGGVGGLVTPGSIVAGAKEIYVGSLGLTGFPGGIAKFANETLVGNTLVDRPLLDTATGSVFVVEQPFSASESELKQWSVFNNSTAGRSVTPLLLETDPGGGWKVVGVGTTRTIAATGAQTFDFGLISGSASAAGRYLGWKDGTAAGVSNAGAIEFTGNTSDAVFYISNPGALGDGSVLPAGTSLLRTYSVQAVTAPQPVNYDVAFASVEALQVHLGDGDDSLMLRNRPGTEVASVKLYTGGGDDIASLPDLAAVTEVHLGDGDDEAHLHSLRAGTSVQVFGDAGSDTIEINQVGESATTEVTGGLGADLVRVAGKMIPTSAATILHGTGTDTAPYDVFQYNPAGLAISPLVPNQSAGNIQAGQYKFDRFFNLVFTPETGGVQYDTFESVQAIAAPVITLTQPAAISEGETAHLAAIVSPLGSTNSLAEPLAWDIDGDGHFGEVLGTDLTLTWAQLQAFSINDNGTYQIGARAVNGDGFVTVAYTTLTVNNTLAAINLSGSLSASVNTPYAVTFNATDPGDDRIFEWRVDWGDGSPLEALGSNAIGASHAFADPGAYKLSVVGIDEDTGLARSNVLDLTAGVTAAQVSAGGPYQIVEGESLTLTASAPGTPSQYSWDVNGDGIFGDTTGASPTLTWAELQALPSFVDQDKGSINPQIKFSPSVRVIYESGTVVTSAPAQLTVLNRAPTATLSNSGPANEGALATVSFLNSTDPSDADTTDGFLYSVDFDNDGKLDVENSTDSVIDIPLQYRNDAGTHNIRGLIIDKDGGSTELFTRLVVNEVAPALVLNGAASANEGEAYQLNFSAGDPGNDTISQWLIDWNDGSVEAFAGTVSSATHSFADDGLRTVKVTAIDEDGTYDAPQAINVVNVAPQLSDVAATNSDEGGFTHLTGGIADAGVLDSFILAIDWGDGNLQSVDFVAGTARFDLTHSYLDDNPSGTAAGNYAISLVLRDDNGGTDAATTGVRVQNLAPTFAGLSVSNSQASENEEIILTASISDAGILDSHQVMIDWGDGQSSVALMDTATQLFTARHSYADDNPALTSQDNYTITATVTDDDGGRSQAATLVTVVNADPVITRLNLGQIQLDASTYQASLQGSYIDKGLLDTHTVSINWGDGVITQANVDALTRTFQAQHDYQSATPPNYAVTATVTDDDGGVATAGVGGPVNRAPVAVDDAARLNRNGTVQLSLLDNDSDLDGDALSAFILGLPGHGSLHSLGSGRFDYQADPGFVGTDSFTYRVSDGKTGSNVATVSIVPFNFKPVAAGDAYTTNEDTSITFDVRTNDSDEEHDLLTVILVDGPSHGNLIQQADGSLSYTPGADYSGADSFSYRLNDGSGDSNLAQVSIVITPVNDTPVAQNDAYTLAEDSTLSAAALGVLANDSDVDGDTLSAMLVTGPQHGTLALNGDGSFSYTPDLNFNGADSFSYRAGDSQLKSSLALVKLIITPVTPANVAPVVGELTLTETQGNGSRSTTLAGSFTDPDLLQTFTASINWGDGSSSAATVDAVQHTFTATHQFQLTALADTFTLTATVSDGQAMVSASVISDGSKIPTAPVFVTTPANTLLTAPAPVGGAQDRVFRVAGNPGDTTPVTFDLGALDTGKYDIGLYRVDDTGGRIGTLQPGEAGYTDAALAAGRALTLFNVYSKAGSKTQLDLAAGGLYSVYMLVNPARINTVGSSPTASASYGSNVLFSVEGANPEAYDQLRGSVANGKLQLGWDSAALAGDHNYSHVQLSAQGFDPGGQAAFSYAAKAEDVNGDSLSYSLVQGPSGAHIDPVTGLLTFLAPPGSHDIIIAASDGQHAPVQQTVHLNVVASQPQPNAMTAFTATANGFRVRLEHAFDPAQIDLGNSANVQLSGTNSGLISGTLLIDDDRAGFTFHKSGGVLLDDLYTVTLGSAADAFVQASGNTTATFTAAGVAGATRISISDAAGTPGQAVNGGLSVSLTNATATAASVRFALRYDPALLTLTGATLAGGLPAGARLATDLTTPGYARFTITSRLALPAGTVPLINLSAIVPGTAPIGSMQLLKVVDRYVNGALTVLNSDGLQRVAGSVQPLLAAAAPATATHALADTLDAAELPAAALAAEVREIPASTGISYFDTQAGSFVKADRQRLPIANTAQDDFMIVMEQGSDRPRHELYELRLSDDQRDTAVAPVTPTDESETPASRFKRMAARFNWKK